MPRLISADVIDDSTDDWAISDEGKGSGAQRGPITTWPAPILRHDDRNPLLPFESLNRRRGQLDAYDFLREKVTSRNLFGETRGSETESRGFESYAQNIDASGEGGVSSPTRTEVRSPTSTRAHTQGNFTATVTGGAGSGANTRVSIQLPRGGIDASGCCDAGILLNPSDFRAFISRTDAGALDNVGKIALGQVLTPGQRVASPNGAYVLMFQQDGNLVLYTRDNKAIWDSASQGKGGKRLIFQKDSNFVMYNAQNKPVWASNTVGHNGVEIAVQNDGNLVMYDRAHKPVWETTTWGGTKHEASKGGFFAGVGSAIGSVGKGVVSIAKGVATPVAALAASPFKLASDVASGKNVFNSLKDTVKRDLASTKAVAPYVQAVMSVVPGVGTAMSGVIGAGLAIAQGQPITSALVAGIKGSLPGGPLAAAAFDTAYAIARGSSITDAALEAAIKQIPGGEVAQMAARTAVAIAKGQNIQQAAVGLVKGAAVSLVPGNNAMIRDAVSDIASGKSLVDTAKRAGGSFASTLAPKGLETVVSDIASGKSIADTAIKAGTNAMATFSPIATGPFSSVGPRIKDTIASQNLNKLLPDNVSTVANAVLKNASLRGLSVNDLAAKLNVPNHVAREGMASVLQSVMRSGGASVPHLAPAQELAAKIPMTATFDQGMANFASKMSPIAFSHNARRPMHVGTRQAALGIAKMNNPHIVPVYAQQSRAVSLARAAAINPWQRPRLGANGWIDAGAIDPTALPTLRQGSTGAFVSQWQNILKTTADGKFGPQTTSLTRQFQALKGLTADGIVGPNTWKAGLLSIAAPISTPVSVPGLPPISVPGLPPVVSAPIANAMPTIRQGSTGTAVKTWQAIVGVPVDGQFGPQTATATRAWQSKNGLTADGIVGPNTWTKALAGGATTIPQPPPATTPGIPTSLPPISIPIPGGGPPIVVQPPTPTPPWSETPPIFQPPTSVPTAPPIVTTTTPIPGGPVITTTTPTGGGPIVVSQPPITEHPTKAGMGPGIAIAVGLGLLLFVAKGSSGKLV